MTQPPYCLARGSTKHEPGFKNRALQAGNDEHSFITAYASEDMEHKYKFNGVVISQKPKDVAEWYAIQLSRANDWHVSYDYDAWNMQVLNQDQELLNLYISLAYLEVGEDWSLDKAIAAFWTAQSNRCQFLDVGGTSTRTIAGLYSGTRNTARDNSLIHEMYQEIVAESLYNLCGKSLDMKLTRKSGDDETCIVDDFIQALMYVRCVEEVGYIGKRSKLMIAQGNSEFLQLVLDESKIPVYPVAPVIAVFTSGNWYKRPVRDYPSIVPALTDQLWNLAREGMDINFTRNLLARTADWFMQIPVADSLVGINWTRYISKSLSEHPLLADIEPGIDWPKIEVKKDYVISSQKATQDALNSENQWWELFDRQGENVEKKARLQDSFAKSIRHDLDKKYCEEAARVLELRSGHTKLKMVSPYIRSVPWSILLKKSAGGLMERYTDSMEQVCIRYKAPPTLIKRILNTPDFSKLPAKMRSELWDAIKNTKQRMPDKWYSLPPPMRAVG
jgi:hypothetical protein